MTAGPALLAGIRVVDLSRVLAGPLAGRILSDLGADVVKVEPPDGDITRIWGKRIGGLSGYYTQQNAGKRNVSVDLNAPEGAALVADLAAVADVVIENFRPGVLARFGLDWRHLRERNPRLVMLSISGFGQTGPEAGRAAYAPVIHAESGVIMRQSEIDGIEPLDQIISVADMLASLHGVIGLLAAVLSARETGVGQHVDIAMLHAMCFTDDGTNFALDGAPFIRGGGEVWQTGAGPFILAGDPRWVWKVLVDAHGLTDGRSDDAGLPEKIEARRAAVSRFLSSLTTREQVAEALDAAGIAWGEARRGDHVYESATLAARGAIREIDDRTGGRRRVLDSPYRFSAATSGVRGPAPYRGEHNCEVLAEWLGADTDRVDALVAAGVLVAE